ncbi:MAG: YezD family protein [Acidobacteria bacterium]|nr:YezD family protein [Acidobacteriota bacterium]
MNSLASDEPGSQDVEREILLAIRSIRYGSVEVIIHDSKVVQIERKEKVRFGKESSSKEG